MNRYKISYNWDKESFLKASKEAYDYELKNSNKRYIGWFFIGLTQFGVVAVLKKSSPGLLYLSTFFVLYWYYLRWKIREYILKKSFKNEPQNKIDVIATKESLDVNGHKIPWSDLDSLIRLDNGYILRGKGKFLYFPKKATNNDFIGFIREELKREKK